MVSIGIVDVADGTAFKRHVAELKVKSALVEMWNTVQSEIMLAVNSNPTALVSTAAWQKGELCFVPYTTNVVFAEQGSTKADMYHRDATCILVKGVAAAGVQAFLKKPSINVCPHDPAETLENAQQFVVPFWVVTGEQDVTYVNMHVVEHKVRGMTVPVMKNIKPIGVGDALKVYKGTSKKEFTDCTDDAVAANTSEPSVVSVGRGRGDRADPPKRARGRGRGR